MQGAFLALALAAMPEAPRIAAEALGPGRTSVIAFGAVPDGKTDASQAFSDAIASLKGTGGTVEAPPGRYLLAK